MTEQPGRHTADTITDDQLDQLYARIATLEAIAAGNKRHVQLIVPDLEAALTRAEQAEAAIARIREVIAPFNWPYAEVRARDVRHALDGPPKTPEEPPQHLSKGDNAENCPACSGTNLPYPFLCPGPEQPAEPKSSCDCPPTQAGLTLCSTCPGTGSANA